MSRRRFPIVSLTILHSKNDLFVKYNQNQPIIKGKLSTLETWYNSLLTCCDIGLCSTGRCFYHLWHLLLLWK